MARQIILTKQDGRLVFDQEPAAVFEFLSNGQYVLTIKRMNTKRSIAQNDLMWMWFACIERETGTPKQDVHDYYCRQFLRRQITWNDETITVIGETKKLNTQQMTEFLNHIQSDAREELGITLPRPEDRFFEAFYNQFNY